ncbi:hypothetical protein N7528_006145 [Penicillium herquei]|nr:hypothetical protein N7528_006145 [Penicillium herquei]
MQLSDLAPSDIATADEEWLIDLCHKAEKDGGMIGGNRYGNKVIKISDRVVVKYGGVQESEAAIQKFAFNTVDRNIVHIPEVYRFVESSHRSADLEGYLFMEYIHGKTLENIDFYEHPSLPSRVANILIHLGKIISPDSDHIPGPLHEGQPLGYIFGAKTNFTSLEDLTAYMNKRLQCCSQSKVLAVNLEPINLEPYAQNLVLCHGDISRRNIILQDVGSLGLVHWGYSGFYPRFFELATLKCILTLRHDEKFEPVVMGEVEKLLGLTDQEKRDIILALYVQSANLRWSW